jgi:hypothetical protein
MTIWAQGLALLLLGAWTSKGAGSAPVLLLCKPKQGEKRTYAQEGSSIKRRLGCLVRTDGPWRPHGRAAPRSWDRSTLSPTRPGDGTERESTSRGRWGCTPTPTNSTRELTQRRWKGGEQQGIRRPGERCSNKQARR